MSSIIHQGQCWNNIYRMVDFLLHPALWSSAAFCAIPPWNPWWITSEWRLKWHTFSCHHVIGVYGYIYPICRELSWHVNIVASTQSVHCMGHLFTAQRGFLLRSRISPAAENHSVQCISVLYMAQFTWSSTQFSIVEREFLFLTNITLENPLVLQKIKC